MNILNKVINKFKKNLEEIINKLKKLEDNLDTYYNTNNNILNNYEINKSRNYFLLINIKNIFNNINNEINKLKNKYNYGYNTNDLLYLYSEINSENSEIELKYQSFNNNQESVYNKENERKL